MTEATSAVFDRLGRTEFPIRTSILFDTTCVLGGSVAGLLAARLLADYSRQVVLIEQNEITADERRGPSVPHETQIHTLLPSGQRLIDRLLPDFTKTAMKSGAVLARPTQITVYFDDHQQVVVDDHPVLMASRPFLETRLRERVSALNNVVTLRARVTGIDHRDGGTHAVRYLAAGVEHVQSANFVIDAMGRASKLSNWLAKDGYDQPTLSRIPSGISYTTAMFKRGGNADQQPFICCLNQLSPQSSPHGLAVAAISAIEDDQWCVCLATYGETRPHTNIDAFRATCATLPKIYAEATSGPLTRDIVTYHQAEAWRRDFASLSNLPSRLVSVGDAVASFNPVYGQGMSSAALHVAALSEYLGGSPDLTAPATDFFETQQVAVDAAWAMSAGGDMARMDAATGAAVPDDVQQQRWAVDQIIRASLVDEQLARAFRGASFMLAHPDTLGAAELVNRAVAINHRVAAGEFG
jgi:2-polyprenyl-6-methoxyphenol hydroxylase-like FAD-dependent oxidoreductase